MAMTIEPQESADTRRGGIPTDSFANRLMLARAFAGHLSIREAADLCGIGRGAWTNWEKGARPADIIDVATEVADKLGVDRDWLLFGGNLSQEGGKTPRRRKTSDKPCSRSDGRSDDAEPRRPRQHPPFVPRRVDPSRPMSAVPARTRRPRPVRPGERRPAR